MGLKNENTYASSSFGSGWLLWCPMPYILCTCALGRWLATVMQKGGYEIAILIRSFIDAQAAIHIRMKFLFYFNTSPGSTDTLADASSRLTACCYRLSHMQ